MTEKNEREQIPMDGITGNRQGRQVIWIGIVQSKASQKIPLTDIQGIRQGKYQLSRLRLVECIINEYYKTM